MKLPVHVDYFLYDEKVVHDDREYRSIVEAAAMIVRQIHHIGSEKVKEIRIRSWEEVKDGKEKSNKNRKVN